MKSKGTGWIAFSSIILIVAGIMRILDGIWAIRVKGELQDSLFFNDVTTYGWLWLAVGVMLVLAGVAVSQGSSIGRWVGILAASLAAISAMAWMPIQPVWSLTYVIVAFMVIYGLVVYGGEALEDA